MNNSDNNSRKPRNNKFPHNRLAKYFKEEKMQYSENFDDFLHNNNGNNKKQQKAEWERLMKSFQNKMQQKADEIMANGSMIVMFEDDYQNLIEMRGFFKMSNRPDYVDTINKILNTLNQKEI